jgi:hypothetical protein
LSAVVVTTIKHRGCEPGICVDADEAHNEGSASLKCSVTAVFPTRAKNFLPAAVRTLPTKGAYSLQNHPDW